MIPELTKEAPNLPDTRKKIFFHDQLVMAAMEIEDHLILVDEISNSNIFIIYYEDLHMAANMNLDVVVEMIEDVSVTTDIVDLYFHIIADVYMVLDLYVGFTC